MPTLDHLFHSNGLLIFQIEQWTTLLISTVLLAVKGYALVNALMFSAESYPAADKLTKVLWVLILAMGLLTAFVFYGGSPIGIFQLAFTTAAFVFLCDVKPALADLRR